MVPTSRETFKNWCLRALGHPVILINVDDEQVDDRVDEALHYWQEFHFNGSEKKYVAYAITQDDIDNKYITVADNIWSITRIFPFTNNAATGDGLFDLNYQMHHNDVFGLRGTSMILGNLQYYVMTRQYLELSNMLLVGDTPISFNRHTDRLYIHWDWDTKVEVGDYILMECFQVLDPDTYADIWADDMLAELCIAMIKRQWGMNMSKYGTVQLMGGVTMNGLELKAEAQAEIAEIKQRIRDTYEAPPQMFMG